MNREAEFVKRNTLLAFPTEFPIKIMGRREDSFAQGVMEIVLRHSPNFDPATMEMRPSRKGKYLGFDLPPLTVPTSWRSPGLKVNRCFVSAHWHQHRQRTGGADARTTLVGYDRGCCAA